MRVNAERAIDLSGNLSPDELDESNPLFWALAKLAENVEESITNLDELCPEIYGCLIEIPVSGLPEQSETTILGSLERHEDPVSTQVLGHRRGHSLENRYRGFREAHSIAEFVARP